MNSRSYLEETVIARFEAMAEKYPRNTAVVFLGEKFSYLKLNGLARRFAAGLSHQGVKPGDRVVIYISNCIQWVVAFLGIQKIGAVVMPVSPIYTSHEIEYMIKDAGAETIICHDTNFGYVKEILAQDAFETGDRHQPGGTPAGLEAGHRHPVRQDPRGQGRTGQLGFFHSRIC